MRLRKTLHHVVTITLGATSACASHASRDDGCTEGDRRSVVVNQLDDKLRALRERCRPGMPEHQCNEFCRAVAPEYNSSGITNCSVVDAPDSTLMVSFTTNVVCVGRRPRETASVSRPLASVAEFLAAQAQLEAISVAAFEELARSLKVHGAPAALIRAARRAAIDELAHASTCRRLARQFGARPGVPPTGSRSEVPSLQALAIDNAIEGEVRETWGATVATWQARTASNRPIRRAMQQIARDETRHAELASRISIWARTRLSERSRRRVERSRDEAIMDLTTAIAAPVPVALIHHAGLPGRTDAQQLIDRLRRSVWARRTN